MFIIDIKHFKEVLYLGKKKFFRGLTAFTLAFSLGVSSLVTNHDVVKAETKPKQVKNIIFMIGDGMGVSYLTAHRYMKDNPDTFVVENTTFDDYLIGMQSTNPEDEHQNITDSASAATAMSAGIKTYNAAIAVDNDKTEVKTVLEAAKEKGMSTGLVATSEITHATPAAYGAHDVNRKNMNAIADDYYDELINGQHKIDVMLGGGLKNFIREDRSLVEEFKKDGYSFVTNEDELLKDNNERILGLFAEGGLPKRIDRTEETPDLEEMTREAIERLSKNENGFFLMVEGSQIDWAGHDNDIVAAMSEMEDFEQAFKVALDFAKKDGETLVVLTADHSTGGFSLGANGIYNWFPEPIKAAKRTPDFMAEKIVNGANVRETLKKYIALDLTEEEIKSVEDAAQTKDLRTIDDAIEAIFNTRSVTGWTTGGHTGEDVAVYGYGPQIERFAGKIDNTDHAKIIFDILENKKVNKPKTGQTPADMKEGQFAYNEIQHLISQNVISLDDKGNYYPNKSITRAEAAVMLQRALNLEMPTDLNAFKDVNENHPYAKEIAATKAKGIFKGKADGTFGVNDVLTREQMATILVRAFSLKAQNHVQVKLSDLKSASPAHQENIKILYQNGVTTGRKGGMFDPRSKTTRAEFAVFLYRALNLNN